MIIATGFFDGVHLGHKHVLKKLVSLARERREDSMVISFWPHPRNVLQDEARNLRLLTSLEEKKELINSLGVDHFEIIEFTKDFSRLTTDEYLKKIIKDHFGGTAIVLGYDNRFGCDQGGPEDMEAIAHKYGVEPIRTGKILSPKGLSISSTKIREVLSKGDVESACDMLGYDYTLQGVVVAGNRLGGKIGYPTANIQLYEPLKLIPGNGVYLVKVETLGKVFYGMCNVGVRPTVGPGNFRTIETNIFDFNEDIYGLDVRLSFIQKLRDEKRFSGLSELRSQLSNDEKRCREIMNLNNLI